MKKFLLIPLVALLSSCDSGSKSDGLTIAGVSPALYYQRFVDQDKKCSEVINFSKQENFQLKLNKDNTFKIESTITTARVSEEEGPKFNPNNIEGTWVITDNGILLSSDETLIATAKAGTVTREDKPIDILTLQYTSELVDTYQSRGVYLINAEKDTCENPDAKATPDKPAPTKMNIVKQTVKTENGADYELVLEADIARNTLSIVSRPADIKANVFLLSMTDELKKFKGERGLFASCEALSNELRDLEGEAYAAKAKTLATPAGVVDFDVYMTFPEDLYTTALEQAKEKKNGEDFVFLPERTTLDPTQLEPSFKALSQSLIDAAEDDASLAEAAKAVNVYGEVEAGEKYQVSLGALCDLSLGYANHFGYWSMAGRKAFRLNYDLDVSSLK